MSLAKPELQIGLIGTGFMGKAHAYGYANASRVFDLPVAAALHTVADINAGAAQAAARAYGFATATADWRDIVENSAIDIVSVTSPNALHKEMSLAAIATGKHVFCEKPLATSVIDAQDMVDAAEKAGVKTQVGFNYLCSPMIILARDMIVTGELGEIRSYRGLHAEDYMADETAPFAFRHDPAGGGALADLGSHALATAEFLLGPIAEVFGDCATVIDARDDGKGGRRKVEVDDIGRAFLRFTSGVSGSIEANWIATGRKMQHDFEIHGSKGSLFFSGERLNELHHYSFDTKTGRQGFTKIEAGPQHPPYGAFIVAPGHQIGFNDLKTIEVAGYLAAISGISAEPFNFRAGLRIQSLVEDIQTSAREKTWRSV